MVGVVITFGCSMYVELISSFHICSITINASARDAVHASHSPGDVAFSEEPEVLKTKPGEIEKCKKTLGDGFACFYMCCKLQTEDK